ncbi:MAG: ATP-binding cassette domain-containing protein, partial [Epsilonproteobacteria bacterium]|nr:ATP-binding cassette domain-containing protein [Campylobacterota bacterium]
MRFKVPIFDVKNLSYTVRTQKILSNISFEIFNAEYIAIIGPNGGGKTTLIRLLLGLEKPSAGEIRIFGKKPSEFKAWHKIGYVPQRASLVDLKFPATVEDIVKMGLIGSQKGFSLFFKDTSGLVKEAMQKMDVYELKEKM